MTDREKVLRLIESEKLPAGAVDKIGEGAFGAVFLVDAKQVYVVKLFKKRGMAASEAVSLREMSKFDRVTVPEIYGLYKREEGEFLTMSYLRGTPMSDVRIGRAERGRAAKEIAAALTAFMTEAGSYGTLHGTQYEAWRDFYFEKSKILFEKALKQNENRRLSDNTYRVMRRAYGAFDKIFDDPAPIRRAFIHGDLNPENIMLCDDGALSGFYDPIGSFYGDAEYELFQLETNGGKRYPVIKEYRKIVAESPKYPLKRDFYRLFAEVGYTFDASIAETHLIRTWARSLRRSLKRFEIV